MKLMYKINLVAMAVLVAVGLAIAMAGVSTIRRVCYDLHREVMAREVDNVVASLRSAFDILVKNRLDAVESYKRQAQRDVIAELDDYHYGETGQLIIVTAQNTVIKHEPLATGQPCNIEHIDTMVRNGSGNMEFFYQGRQRYFSYKLFPQWNWLVILSVTSEEILAARDQFMGQVAAILLASLILGALVFVWFIRRVVGPIRQLAVATALVSEGKWDAPLPQPRGSDEVARLTEAFRVMARRLAEMYGSLRANLRRIEQSQSALMESEEKYRGLVELLPLSVFEIDTAGRFVLANRNLFETFGYTETDLAGGIYLHDIIRETDRERLEADMARILEGHDPGMMEYAGKRKDKGTFPCIALATPIFQHDKPVGIRGIFIDITERKTLEIELRQAREFLDKILNNVADPIFVKDERYGYILLNDAYCRFIGSSREDAIGKTDHDFFSESEADEFRRQDDLAFSSQHPREEEAIVTHAQNRERVILTKRAVFSDTQEKNLLVGIVKDITERKQMEQELFKSDKLKSIGVLAGGIAHDFNNILTAVIGNLSLAKILARPDTDLFRYLRTTEKATFQAKDLTQQLLTFSRGGAPVKKTVSLPRLIEESASFTLSGSKVRCNIAISDDLWPVDVDEGQISRVIHNIVVNAMQAMPDGGTVCVLAKNHPVQPGSSLPLKAGRYVRLVIKDHGVGIPRELLSDIFDPYFTTKEEGSGLGLATAFSIVKRHDGCIGVESEPGAGTTFSVYLPASDNTVSIPEKMPCSLCKGRGKVLVMDDEAILRQVVGEMLEVLGYDFETADDGSQALEKYKRALDKGSPFDLVIMDLTIPGAMGGREAIAQLLALDSDARAIVSSGYSNDPVMANYKKHGFAGVITKPYELEKLGQVLHQVLAGKDSHY